MHIWDWTEVEKAPNGSKMMENNKAVENRIAQFSSCKKSISSFVQSYISCHLEGQKIAKN